MNDNATKNPQAPNPATANQAADQAARNERLELIRKFQADAMKRPDALSANLGVINSDLMRMLSRLSEALEKSMANTEPGADRHFAQQAETYLKFVRQIDRLAQLDRQLQKPSAPEA